MNNEDKVKNYKMKKMYKSLIIILSLLTIILESFALFGTISFLWGFIPFFLSYYFKGLYEDVRIKDMFKRKKKCCLEDTKSTSTVTKCEDEKKTDDKIKVTEKDTETENGISEEKVKEETVTVSKNKNTKKVTKTNNTSKRGNNNSSKNYKNKNNSKSTNNKNNKSNYSKTSTKNVKNNKRTSSK